MERDGLFNIKITRTFYNFLRLFTCSVKGVVGIKDCGEEAEGESTDAEGHVKASVSEALEHLSSERKHVKFKNTHKKTWTNNLDFWKATHPASTFWLCSLSLRPRWSFQPEQQKHDKRIHTAST